MCGIAGLYDSKGSAEPLDESIRRMTDALTHRGPDDSGYHLEGRMALGHRRLSIIDLEGGHQPIFNEDKTKCVIFNGEIYNYRELRDGLLNKGHRFSTNSDTETILHAYEEWGEECVQKLRGMFAFCIWDSQEDTMFIARDRLGIKPLFYAEYNGKFVFSSEIKSILSDPGFRRSIDKEAMASYLMYSYIPAPLSIYNGIKKLPPGHLLIYKNRKINVREYWDLYFEPNRQKKEKDFISEFMDILKESVNMRLMSDVPLGAFLSGGIDSSAVVALMSQASPKPVNTFTIGFGGDTGSFEDERKYAKLVADRYKTMHREHEVNAEIGGLINKIVTAFDEPFADDATIPSYFVCKMARQYVTVALSGLGGDEAFCGYDRYLGFSIGRFYNHLPRMIRENIIKRYIETMDESPAGDNRVNRLKRFVRSSSSDDSKRYLGYLSKITERYRDSLFCGEKGEWADAIDSSNQRFLKYFDAKNAEDPLDKVFYCDIKTYLPEDILACTDRLSMHHSLEVRVPFLDHKLIEYSATIPSGIKMKWFRKKYLLKKAFSAMLPDAVIHHKKQGFVGPMAQWLQSDLKAITHETLAGSRIERHGIFNKDTIKTILNDHYAGRETNDTLVWSLLVFQTWFDLYMDPKTG